MFASIQVLLDGSPAADSALHIALSLASATKAHLRGLFVEDLRRFEYYPPVDAMSAALGAAPMIPVPLPKEDLATAEQDVKTEGAAIKARFDAGLQASGVDGALSVVRGYVLDEMLVVAPRADLVVLGCRTASSDDGATDPGTRIEALLRECVRPVILVPAGSSAPAADAAKKIVVGFDRSDTARRTLREAAGLAREIGASIDVLTIGNDDSQANGALAEAGDYLAPWKLDVTTHHLKGRAREVLVNHARDVNATMLAMGAFGHNRMREFLFGSATRHVLEHLPCPVMLSRH